MVTQRQEVPMARTRLPRWRTPHHPHRGPVSRREGDIAAGDPLRPPASGEQLATAEHLAQDDPHLELGERGAQAATNAASERNPSIRLGRAVEEALGPEGQWVRVEVG